MRQKSLNLLGGAPRLRTLHDLVPELEAGSPYLVQAAMRRYMERAKGTFHDGTTAYGVMLLRGPGAPAPVLDAFGGVALTLTRTATERATFLPVDSMLTAQRPATFDQLPSVVAERVLRDAGFVDAMEMNDARLSDRERSNRIRAVEAAVRGDASRVTELLNDPQFGRGMLHVEAQVPNVTLADVQRIDVSTATPIAQRDRIVELAERAGIPVAVASSG